MNKWKEAWYLLSCKTTTWKTTLQAIEAIHLETCCPLLYERRRRTDKKNGWRQVCSPLFPGYIFIRFNPATIHTSTIATLPGVMDFVRFGKNIATVSDECMAALLDCKPRALSADSHNYECAYLSTGLARRVDDIYHTANPAHRVNLLVSLLALPPHLTRDSFDHERKLHVREQRLRFH
ncbi:transcription termination/antitermination NusG family protein [Erwinia typographi]|uniref:transcription termination/antitermination NusG family protein n=1 Tax=Erwinia typographi TaxID=371042 RepID=UPI0009079AFF|nr:transcription termination/antitermination NusG family protein [Erwinia typographi]